MLHDEKMYEIITPNRLLFGQKLYQENRNWESNSDIVKLKRNVFNMLLHYKNAKKVSKRKSNYFGRKMILYYHTKKSSLEKNGC